jgi:hypothetical protein
MFLLLIIYLSMTVLGAIAVTVISRRLELWTIRAGVFCCLLGALGSTYQLVSGQQVPVDVYLIGNVGVVVVGLTAGTKHHSALRDGWSRAKRLLLTKGGPR